MLLFTLIYQTNFILISIKCFKCLNVFLAQ
jgi:hypothetical protein